QGAVGHELRVYGPGESIDETHIHTAAASLVGTRGVGEAIAYHPFPACQRRRDYALYVLRARGEHEQRLGDRRDGLGTALQHDLAHTLGERRTPWLTRQPVGDAPPGEPGTDQLGDGGLAGAFDAFERDELA